MKQQLNSPKLMAEVRQLAGSMDSCKLEQCLELALSDNYNPCYSAPDKEEVVNVLAKASFVGKQVRNGVSIAQAMRELGKRMRFAQGQSG